MKDFEELTCSCMKKNSINEKTKEKNKTFECKITKVDYS